MVASVGAGHEGQGQHAGFLVVACGLGQYGSPPGLFLLLVVEHEYGALRAIVSQTRGTIARETVLAGLFGEFSGLLAGTGAGLGLLLLD